MKPVQATLIPSLVAALLFTAPVRAAEALSPAQWTERHDQLVERLRNVAGKEGAFGPAYRPLFHAAIPWYELWGGRDPSPVDGDMVTPEAYASELAGALEEGRNFFAENPDGLFPLVFRRTLADGKLASANYWLKLPAGFPGSGRSFPLVIDLHGSGWLGHKISFKRGSALPGPTFGVIPINMGGPWQIDFLNGYLDELIGILPVDQDRVYLQGHSLGAMATWEWALDNPERFAAISPRAGIGEPYRAQRLKYVPAWVIHGEHDGVIPNGFAEQMVTALQSQGAGVRYTLIKEGEHNMPPDLDQEQVLAWYLRQTRSHHAPSPDPRDGLGLNAAGFSHGEILALPQTPSWKSRPLDLTSNEAFRGAAALLFQKAHDRNELVDSPLRRELGADDHLTTLWLAVPRTLHQAAPGDPSIVSFPARRVLRFYFRGGTAKALAHLKGLEAGPEAAGQVLTGKVWVTPLSIWWEEGPDTISEYWAEIKEGVAN